MKRFAIIVLLVTLASGCNGNINRGQLARYQMARAHRLCLLALPRELWLECDQLYQAVVTK